MKFTLPPLPYSPDALEPVISKETIHFHYGKHEKGYIDNLNSLIEGTQYEEMPIEEIIVNSEGKLFNNASQTWNHIFYFYQFSPEGNKEPKGELKFKIEEQFGSIEEFKKKFEEAGTTLFGSGWVWLAADENNTLFIIQGKDADNPLTKGLRPILVFDVWEHAYYLDYQNQRGDYLKKLWDIIDWEIIERRFLGS
ncbi:MAG: superoxide dismutase [Muribaculaceae bacterium]|nr:superoxide dismutase [Muribaculaceae bacterium]